MPSVVPAPVKNAASKPPRDRQATRDPHAARVSQTLPPLKDYVQSLVAGAGDAADAAASAGIATDRLEAYLELLMRWGRVHNLVAKRDLTDRDRLERRHLRDSMALLPWVRGHLADIGSGGGFPGVPLAILRPDEPTTLIERSTKKARFLRQVALELDLPLEVLEQDARCCTLAADTVTVRAVAKVAVAWQLARPLLRPGGAALLQKRLHERNVAATDVPGGTIERTASCGDGAVTVVRTDRPT